MDSGRALIVTTDDGRLDDLLRLAAAAGVEADVSRDVGLVRARWRSASVVLLGADRLSAAVRAGLPRRGGVLLVGSDPLDASGWTLAVAIGAEQVLLLPESEARLVELLADCTERAAAPGRLIAVVSGRGGAGASVLATALAVTAGRLGEPVLLLDADPLGGGLDVLLGLEGADGLRWPDLAEVSGRVSAAALRQALPSAYGVAVLAHERRRTVQPSAEAMVAVTGTARRAGTLVIADLPRYLDPGVEALLGTASRVLLVVPADVRSCVAAGRVAETVRMLTDAVSAVVRVVPGGQISAEVIEQRLGLPLAAVLRTERGLPARLERGEPPAAAGRGSLATVCRGLLNPSQRSPSRRRREQPA